MATLPPVPEQPAHTGIVLFGPTPVQLAWIVNTIHHDLELIAAQLDTVIQSQEAQKMATDALTQAVTDLKNEVAGHASKIENELAQLLTAQANGDQPAIDAAAQSIRDTTAQLQGLDVSLDADDPAAPPTA